MPLQQVLQVNKVHSNSMNMCHQCEQCDVCGNNINGEFCTFCQFLHLLTEVAKCNIRMKTTASIHNLFCFILVNEVSKMSLERVSLTYLECFHKNSVTPIRVFETLMYKCNCKWPWWALDLRPRYGHVILVSRYLVLAGAVLIITWMSNIKDVQCRPTLHVSVNLLFGIWPPSCATRSRRQRCRLLAYAPTSNTASHDNHKKINSLVLFSLPYMGIGLC